MFRLLSVSGRLFQIVFLFAFFTHSLAACCRDRLKSTLSSGAKIETCGAIDDHMALMEVNGSKFCFVSTSLVQYGVRFGELLVDCWPADLRGREGGRRGTRGDVTTFLSSLRLLSSNR